MGVAGPGSAVRAALWGRGQVMDLQGLFTTWVCWCFEGVAMEAAFNNIASVSVWLRVED